MNRAPIIAFLISTHAAFFYHFILFYVLIKIYSTWKHRLRTVSCIGQEESIFWWTVIETNPRSYYKEIFTPGTWPVSQLVHLQILYSIYYVS